METRKRYKINYDDEYYQEHKHAFTVSDIESTSNWNVNVTKALKIEVKDIHIQYDMFDCSQPLHDEAKLLVLPEWKNNSWFRNIDIKLLTYNNKIKTLIGKIRNVAINSITEMYVDGFMDSLLHILCFDDYPCYLYPQYQFTADIGQDTHTVTAKADFSVLSESSKMLLVIEDKTVTNATYANNWKEDQVLGELFVAVHNVVAKSKVDLVYPINIYAIRVIGTLFTFYKTVATLDYIRETARNIPVKNQMTILRHPPVEDNPSKLTAYDICDNVGRNKILECMCSIQRFIST